jgi:SAM-dependent methyltransferase
VLLKRLRRLITPADPAILHELREVFRRADFTVPAITALLGNAPRTDLNSRSPRLLHATRSGSALDTLIRLFIAGVPVPLEQAEAALQPVPITALSKIGVARIASGSVTPLISILPHDDLIIASDQPSHSGKAADYVPGMLDSSVFLELFTIRRPLESALDIGAGCGVQALRASLHTTHVAAVDASARALDFARFNSALDGFEPVGDLRFDLIVGNLPFVITPSGGYMYRDSGMRLDDFARRIIKEAPHHLNHGGYCQLLFQWVEVEGQDWRDRLGAWFDASGCDVWVMKNDSLAPDAYAEKWIADTEPRPVGGVDRLFQQWMEFYEAERITAIHSGAVAMRLREGNNWLRMDDGPDRARSPFGDAVLKAFALSDYLQNIDDSRLLDQCLRVSPDVHLIQRSDWSAGEWRPDAGQLRFHRELEYMANVDQYVSKLVARCTGERTVCELVDELAAQTGMAADRLRPACLQLVRGLVERGFLLPVQGYNH